MSKDLERRLAEQNVRLERLRREVAIQRTDVASDRRQIADLERQEAALVREVADLENTLMAERRGLAEVKTKAATVEAKLAAVESKIAGSSAALTREQEALDAKRAAAQARRAEHDSLLQEISREEVMAAVRGDTGSMIELAKKLLSNEIKPAIIGGRIAAVAGSDPELAALMLLSQAHLLGDRRAHQLVDANPDFEGVKLERIYSLDDNGRENKAKTAEINEAIAEFVRQHQRHVIGMCLITSETNIESLIQQNKMGLKDDRLTLDPSKTIKHGGNIVDTYADNINTWFDDLKFAIQIETTMNDIRDYVSSSWQNMWSFSEFLDQAKEIYASIHIDDIKTKATALSAILCDLSSSSPVLLFRDFGRSSNLHDPNQDPNSNGGGNGSDNSTDTNGGTFGMFGTDAIDLSGNNTNASSSVE